VNAQEAQSVVAAVLRQIAPEADLDDVEADEDLRTGLDLDSLDFLSLIEGLKERTGVDVPEAEYSLVRSRSGMIRYLVAHTS
jgi:acyl carrier protein